MEIPNENYVINDPNLIEVQDEVPSPPVNQPPRVPIESTSQSTSESPPKIKSVLAFFPQDHFKGSDHFLKQRQLLQVTLREFLFWKCVSNNVKFYCQKYDLNYSIIFNS